MKAYSEYDNKFNKVLMKHNCSISKVIIKLRSVGPRGQERSQSKRKSHRKVTKLVLTVITVYIICWLPHWVTQIALIR